MKPSLSRMVALALCPLVNAGLLLAPAFLIGLDLRAGGLELGLFLLGASALCLADAAGQDDRQWTASRASRPLPFEWLAWAQALSVLATFQAGLVEHLLRGGASWSDVRLETLGAFFMLSGALLRYTAIRTLGRHFVTEIRVGPELVRRGVYRRVRHPSETGLVLAMAGSALLLSSTMALGVLAFVLLPVVVARTRREDAALAATFGVEHARYSHEAGRLLPRFSRSWLSEARPVARTLPGARAS